MKRTIIAAVLLLSAPYLLLAEGDDKAAVKTAGEVEMNAGYGHTSPYEAEVKLNISGNKVHFSPFVAVKGITPYSSAHIEREDYTYTGTDFFSENPGNRFLSSKETESRGTVSEYGFHLNYRPAAQHSFSLAFEGENIQRSETGSLSEEMIFTDGRSWQAEWNLDSPLLRENVCSARAGYRFTYSPKGQFEFDYSFRNESEGEEKHIDAISLQNFGDFSSSLVRADANIVHHNLHLALKQSFNKAELRLAARYEGRNIRSNDLQWLDGALVLEDHFRHNYGTGAFLASCRYVPVNPLRLFAELEYAYTDIQGRKCHDFLPKAAIEWQASEKSLFSLHYDRSLLRPSFSLLNPAEIRLPSAIVQGNEELVGSHMDRITFEYDLLTEKCHFHLNNSFRYSKDGFNGIWLEKNNVRIYKWGNEGILYAWSLTPSIGIKATESTEINALATVIWDKRYAAAVDMTNANWGFKAHIDVKQALPSAFAISISGDMGYGSTLNLYKREGFAYNAGLELSRKFGKHVLSALEGRFYHFASDIIGRGAYTGSVLNCPEHIFSLALKVQYSF